MFCKMAIKMVALKRDIFEQWIELSQLRAYMNSLVQSFISRKKFSTEHYLEVLRNHLNQPGFQSKGEFKLRVANLQVVQ